MVGLSGTQAAATREAVTPPAIPTSDPPTVDSGGVPESCYNTGTVLATGSIQCWRCCWVSL